MLNLPCFLHIPLLLSKMISETTDDMGWRQGHQRCLWNCLSFAGLHCRVSGWAASNTDDIPGDIRLIAFLGDLQPSVTATASEVFSVHEGLPKSLTITCVDQPLLQHCLSVNSIVLRSGEPLGLVKDWTSFNSPCPISAAFLTSNLHPNSKVT